MRGKGREIGGTDLESELNGRRRGDVLRRRIVTSCARLASSPIRSRNELASVQQGEGEIVGVAGDRVKRLLAVVCEREGDLARSEEVGEAGHTLDGARQRRDLSEVSNRSQAALRDDSCGSSARRQS